MSPRYGERYKEEEEEKDDIVLVERQRLETGRRQLQLDILEGGQNGGGLVEISDRSSVTAIASGAIVGTILVVFLLFYICKKRKRRRRYRKNQVNSSNSTVSTGPCPIYSISIEEQMRTPEDVTRRYERSISTLSTKSQIYLVPFDALPPDFDFSSREVEVKADYVILRDLKLLETRNINGGFVNEAFEQQEAYNPFYVCNNIPPLIREPYKKQEPYNPVFY